MIRSLYVFVLVQISILAIISLLEFNELAAAFYAADMPLFFASSLSCWLLGA
jgi:hypothetical protein